MTPKYSSSDTPDLLSRYFPDFSDGELRGLILSQGRFKSFSEGEVLLQPDRPPPFLPLLLEGSIKIFRTEPDGREVFLYFLQAGDTCAVTLGCVRGKSVANIRAVGEEPGALVALPFRLVGAFWDEYETFRNFVVETYRRRFENLLETFDAVAFHRLDERLLRVIRELTSARDSLELPITQKTLAEHVGTTREVVARVLKQMELQGLVKLGRNVITLIDSNRPSSSGT
jgi:CRP/FNR family transcriptional regulator